ncbi:unnamed protein product [Tenebrio molitor]|nr:unnamed protein product [Tenebrio molitor]
MFITNICDAVYPIIFMTAIFGVSSIFLKIENKTRKLKIFNILKILNIIYIAVFSVLLYLAVSNLKNRKLKANYASGVSKIGIIFQLFAQIALTYIIYLVNITKSPNVLSSIKDVKKIDDIFEDLGVNINYRKHFVYEISIISLGFVAILGRGIITHAYMKNSIFSEDDNSHYVLFIPSLISFLAQNNFVLLITLLYERFILINKLLADLAKEKINHLSWKVSTEQEYQMKHGLRRIELLMELHDYLTDVGNKLSDSFTLQILSCLTAQFLTTVFTVFYLYYESMILKNKVSALVWLMWTAWTSLEILYVTVTCHLTTNEAKNTGMAIHKVLLNENDPVIKRKLMVFSQQVDQRPLQFTACGLFSIDATLIFTIVGAAATYLLIMLQFQEGVEAQCSNSTIG